MIKSKTMEANLTPEQTEAFKVFQKNEITEYHIYLKLSKVTKDKKNAAVLEKIGKEEKLITKSGSATRMLKSNLISSG